MVSELGNEDVNFSVCKTFMDTPKNINASRIVSWHFYIKGKSVKTAKGKDEDTDVKINFDYQKASVIAKVIYREGIIAHQKEDFLIAKKNLEKKGKILKEPPDYLSELHNRLAILTS